MRIAYYTLFLNPRNMSGGKLPTAIALDQCVCELHDSIERFAVRCSFHARFSENNCCARCRKAALTCRNFRIRRNALSRCVTR